MNENEISVLKVQKKCHLASDCFAYERTGYACNNEGRLFSRNGDIKYCGINEECRACAERYSSGIGK